MEPTDRKPRFADWTATRAAEIAVAAVGGAIAGKLGAAVIPWEPALIAIALFCAVPSLVWLSWRVERLSHAYSRLLKGRSKIAKDCEEQRAALAECRTALARERQRVDDIKSDRDRVHFEQQTRLQDQRTEIARLKDQLDKVTKTPPGGVR